jgi:hypothetical protein
MHDKNVLLKMPVPAAFWSGLSDQLDQLAGAELLGISCRDY